LVYQVRDKHLLDEQGFAYDPDAVSAADVATLRAYCEGQGLREPITIDAFRDQVFFGVAYDCGAEIVGFNLPFDLARIALDWSPARVTKFRKKMRGGFSFVMSRDKRRPKLQIRKLTPHHTLMEFAAEYRQRTSRSGRRRGDYVPPHRGIFTDVSSLATALLSRTASLGGLAKALATPTQKHDAAGGHGRALTAEYLAYARADVQVTWECHQALVARYRTYGLGRGHWTVASEASIGKATLAAMGVQPWLSANDPSPELMATILSTYFGGRTEVPWRKVVRRVFYTDFTSMYPTVCTLQGLWRFIVAEGFEQRDGTREVQDLLARVQAGDLQDPACWPQLTALVRIEPDEDLVPVRAEYCAEKGATIGLNYLTSQPIWITLADCIVAKILGGKSPRVLEAIILSPGKMQAGLRPISLLGSRTIDPRSEDMFRQVIRLRIQERVAAKALRGQAREEAAERIQFLKLMANSTSYGIFIQVNVDNDPKRQLIEVFSADADPFQRQFNKVEEPGPYFHPLLASLITGAARLMLALAEARAVAEGLDWVFCDTDSLALAKPDDMSEAAFLERAGRVVEWFRPLDPYGVGEPILKAENENFATDGSGDAVPLYCLAISSKRYALFNVGPDGRPIIRKASAHGLGHLRAPYGDDVPAPGIPTPLPEVAAELPRWQHDLWWVMVQHALAGDIHGMRYDWHPALKRPAVSRYAATSPRILGWMDRINSGKPYGERVKPFGFMLLPHTKLPGMGGPKDLRPVAPFHEDPEAAIRQAFDRMTGQPVKRRDLQTYAEALAGYHLSPESKFRNGQAFDVGRTERRHIRSVGVTLIGKEADLLEEVVLGVTDDDQTIGYGQAPGTLGEVEARLAGYAKRFGDSAVARATGLSRAAVSRVRQGHPLRRRRSAGALGRGLGLLDSAADEARARLERLETAIAEHGSLRAAARSLGMDPSNLSKALRRGRRIGLCG
jgi:hypothetical protein